MTFGTIAGDNTVQNDKILGTFMGLAVGDALGAPVEFRRRDSFPLITDMMAGGYFNLPAGAWTDDTAMALCLAESLFDHPDFDAADLIARLRAWLESGYNTSTGKCVGVGQNTFRTLMHCIRTGETLAISTGEKSDGNGAIMRLAPVACMYWNNLTEAMRIADAQSRVTHYSELSAASSRYLAALLCHLISGNSWKQALHDASVGEWPEAFQPIINGDWRGKTREEIRSTGYVIDTLEAALWSVHQCQSLEDTLITAVNLGDDTDSVGAVAGQIAGARYGYSGVPHRWLEPLIQKDHLLNIARKFL